jgi:hypothetical protein
MSIYQSVTRCDRPFAKAPTKTVDSPVREPESGRTPKARAGPLWPIGDGPQRAAARLTIAAQSTPVSAP